MRPDAGSVPVTRAHTLVIGTGAAGLNAAIQLHAAGVRGLLVIGEGLDQGASINTGSDKQTYYKLSMYGDDADSPRRMAEAYVSGGGAHGDLALVEAALSPRAFLHLVGLGVPFPQDAYGQFVGYRTDHDPLRRATSVGPYTSREMCRALIAELRRRRIRVRERVNAVALVTVEEAAGRRAAGAVTLDETGALEILLAENTVFATGGPGGLYRASVYPACQTGAIGLALEAGAGAQGLPESQFGLASTGFRWNVSGTYMQVVPRVISTAADGRSDEREFLSDAFPDPGERHTAVFLKGYQWPFQAARAAGGSSLADLLVYRETVQRGRRVFLDYRRNPDGWSFEGLSPEARDYLGRSGACSGAPIDRLLRMNPDAAALYREHGIDLAAGPLEIAVCAQHNNGGLAADAWWQSTTLRRLFPVGEVNGSHGVARPGGSALNAGQVGGFRAAEYIARRCSGRDLDLRAAEPAGRAAAARLLAWAARGGAAGRPWREDREEFQSRMSRDGALARSRPALDRAVAEAWAHVRRLEREGERIEGPADLAEALRNRHLCLAHAVYLDAIRFALRSGVGSRGSSLALDPGGRPVHPALGDEWRMQPEDPAFRARVLETRLEPDGAVLHGWTPCRPIPEADAWFETAWARHRDGSIYGPAG